ncbi:unnamed protein product [Paramecium primaurelia]|uniref:Uncharacterized protein n=1 Tax=Paramecium primaurelia TaxID=5886 RepID=A0A8S1K4V8_PARPR|nr:unnamed protein product [Paramecium primaurelia]
MDRDLIKGNKICYNYEKERLRQIHKHNLQIAHPLIRTQMERLSQNQNKKLQLQEERFTEIERENRILLEKIQNIMNNERKRATSNWQNNNNMTTSNFNQSQSVNRKQSLNKEKRKKELVRITIENQRLMNRLVTKKPNYNTKIILKQTSQQQQLVQQIAEYPLKRSRIQSSNRQKSVDLSKSSFMGCLPTQTNYTPNNQQSKKIILYKQNKKIDDKLYYIEVFYEDDLFKITVDDEQCPNTKVFEMPQEDGQIVLREIYNNNILQLVDAISVDNNIHLTGLEQFEQSQ